MTTLAVPPVVMDSDPDGIRKALTPAAVRWWRCTISSSSWRGAARPTHSQPNELERRSDSNDQKEPLLWQQELVNGGDLVGREMVRNENVLVEVYVPELRGQ